MADITKLPEPAEENVTNEMLVTFKKPYHWEDHDYTEVDLSGLDNLTTLDLEDAYRQYANDAGLNLATIAEFSYEYASILASKVTKKPIEFFMQMPPKAIMEVRRVVRNYFFGED